MRATTSGFSPPASLNHGRSLISGGSEVISSGLLDDAANVSKTGCGSSWTSFKCASFMCCHSSMMLVPRSKSTISAQMLQKRFQIKSSWASFKWSMNSSSGISTNGQSPLTHFNLTRPPSMMKPMFWTAWRWFVWSTRGGTGSDSAFSTNWVGFIAGSFCASTSDGFAAVPASTDRRFFGSAELLGDGVFEANPSALALSASIGIFGSTSTTMGASTELDTASWTNKERRARFSGRFVLLDDGVFEASSPGGCAPSAAFEAFVVPDFNFPLCPLTLALRVSIEVSGEAASWRKRFLGPAELLGDDVFAAESSGGCETFGPTGFNVLFSISVFSFSFERHSADVCGAFAGFCTKRSTRSGFDGVAGCFRAILIGCLTVTGTFFGAGFGLKIFNFASMISIRSNVRLVAFSGNSKSTFISRICSQISCAFVPTRLNKWRKEFNFFQVRNWSWNLYETYMLLSGE